MSVKEIRTQSGKLKYQAQVWFDQKFIKSKTFDSRAVAAGYEKRMLKDAAAGKAKPAVMTHEDSDPRSRPIRG